LEYRWTLGYRFQELNRGDDYPSAFLLARLVSLLFGMITVVVVYAWSRELFGPAGGMLSLALACFCPNLLAHAHLATIDTGFTSLVLLSSYLLWRWVRSQWRLREGIFFSLAIAAALAAKFTVVLILPLYLMLILIPLSDHAALIPTTRRWNSILRGSLLTAGVALVTINSLYSWEGVGKPMGSMDFQSSTFKSLGSLGPHLPSPLPLWYLKGMDAEKKRIEDRRNLFFYRGEVSRDPHPLYFLHAILLKTPLCTLALFGVAAGFGLLNFRRDFLHLLFPPLLLLVLFSVVIGANLGLRYVLVFYPFLMVFTGVLGPMMLRHRVAGAAILMLVLGTGIATSLAAPRFLSYFNQVAGGPKGGAKVLSDSNIDWGQGLRELRATMEREGINEVYLSYFGLVDPAVYGVSYRPLRELKPGGVVAVSVHHLNGISPFGPLPQDFIELLRTRKPLAWAGDSIVLYQF
jgi:4-amino-4-deoxy-L-arabinose transferase-like glycosyltransferase